MRRMHVCKKFNRMSEMSLRAAVKAQVIAFTVLTVALPAGAAEEGDKLAQMKNIGNRFIDAVKDLVKNSLNLVVSLAIIGLPLLIGIGTAYKQWQKQEQQPGGKVSWWTVVGYGFGAFLATALLAGAIYYVLQTLIGGSWNPFSWLTGSSSTTSSSTGG